MRLFALLLLTALTCLASSQPAKPAGNELPSAGKYKFTAWNADGKKMYTGELVITKWTRNESGWSTDQGQRNVKALLGEKELNPIAGKGYFEGSFQDGRVGFDLHPKFRDFNTTLGGTWKNGKIKGEWGSTTFVGYKKKGTFEMVLVKPKAAKGK